MSQFFAFEPFSSIRSGSLHDDQTIRRPNLNCNEQLMPCNNFFPQLFCLVSKHERVNLNSIESKILLEQVLARVSINQTISLKCMKNKHLSNQTATTTGWLIKPNDPNTLRLKMNSTMKLKARVAVLINCHLVKNHLRDHKLLSSTTVSTFAQSQLRLRRECCSNQTESD